MRRDERILYSEDRLLRFTMPVIYDRDTILPLIFASVGPVKPHDILDVRCSIQATNDNPSISIAWNMFTTLTYDRIYAYEEAKPYRIGKETGRNLLRPIHHDGLVNSYLVEIDREEPACYVALCCTCTPLVQGPGDYVPLKINYGMVTVLKHVDPPPTQV